MKKILSAICGILAAAFIFVGSACSTKIETNPTKEIYMPDGAPALAMAQLMASES